MNPHPEETPSLRTKPHRLMKWIALFGLVLLPGTLELSVLGSTAVPPPGKQQSAQEAAEDLMVVDCLLPGRLRRIGRRASGFTPRRPIRTTAIDCRIRGGEYTAFDRADYKTALAVWLPQAEQGDPEAQTYVAEIYAKGLGREPDYEQAAKWYERAAEQGWARAQINLAAMYEQGLGVPPDYERAQELFGSSSGLASSQIEIKLTSPDQSLEILALQQQLAERNDALAALEGQVKSARAEADELKQRFEQTARRESELQSSIQSLESELEKRRSTATTSVDRAELEKLEQELSKKSAELSQRSSEVAELQEQLDKRNRVTDDSQTKLAQLQNAADSYKSQIASLRSALDKERQEKAIEAVKQGANLAPPLIEIIDPQLLASRGSREVLLRSMVESRAVIGRVDAQAQLLSLVVNDVKVPFDDQGLFEASVPISAERTPVQVVAVDRAGKRGTLTFDLVTEIEKTAPKKNPLDEITKSISWGDYHALVIGNNDYQRWPKLQTAVADANAISALLRDHYGFEVTTLLNATRVDLLRALNELRKELTSESNLLIYYAGHGIFNEEIRRGYWVPVDAETDADTYWISSTELSDQVNLIKARHILIVADSCYAAALTRSGAGKLETGRTLNEELDYYQRLVKLKARVALTSGGLRPVLDSAGGGEHSVFAKELIAVLESNNTILAAQQLHSQLQSRVILAASQQAGYEQIPNYATIRFTDHNGGDFFFVPR